MASTIGLIAGITAIYMSIASVFVGYNSGASIGANLWWPIILIKYLVKSLIEAIKF